MFSCRNLGLALAGLTWALGVMAAPAANADKYPGVGRAATPKELAA